MALAGLLREHEAALRADMQQYYGIDIDHREEHTPLHVAACAVQLPNGSRTLCETNNDAHWSLTDIMLALIYNFMAETLWIVGGKKGREPERIGPSWMRKPKNTRKVDAMAMPVGELLDILNKPRRGVKGG